MAIKRLSRYLVGVVITVISWGVNSGDTNADQLFYVGGFLGVSKYRDACNRYALECGNESIGYGVYAGYQLYSWIALEFGLIDYGQVSAKYLPSDVDVSAKGAEIATRFTYPLYDNFDIYTRLGGHYLNLEKLLPHSSLETNSRNVEPFFAVGSSYHLSKHWKLNSEYKFVDGVGDTRVGKADLHFISLGLSYNFGHKIKEVDNNLDSHIEDEASEALNTDISTALRQSVETSPVATSLLFEFDSSNICDTTALDALIKNITIKPIERIHVVGHTDSIGHETYNLKLSKRRAEAVVKYLKSQNLNVKSYTVEGAGETEPVATNKTEIGRSDNRRVEIIIEEDSNE